MRLHSVMAVSSIVLCFATTAGLCEDNSTGAKPVTGVTTDEFDHMAGEEFLKLLDDPNVNSDAMVKLMYYRGPRHRKQLFVDRLDPDELFDRIANRSVSERAERDPGRFWPEKYYSDGKPRHWPGGSKHRPTVIRHSVPFSRSTLVSLKAHMMPLYPEDYNWEEDARVMKALLGLQRFVECHGVEAIWPSLLNNRSDDRFCCILFEAGNAHAYSVGDMCSKVMYRVALYSSRLTPRDPYGTGRDEYMIGGNYHEWTFPDFVESKDFRERSPREIQIKTCEAYLENPEIEKIPDGAVRVGYVAALTQELNDLRQRTTAKVPPALVILRGIPVDGQRGGDDVSRGYGERFRLSEEQCRQVRDAFENNPRERQNPGK